MDAVRKAAEERGRATALFLYGFDAAGQRFDVQSHVPSALVERGFSARTWLAQCLAGVEAAATRKSGGKDASAQGFLALGGETAGKGKAGEEKEKVSVSVSEEKVREDIEALARSLSQTYLK